MSDHPLPLNAEMVRATLAQTKRQHRLPMKLKVQPPANAWPVYDALDCYQGEGWAFQYAKEINVGSMSIIHNRIFPLPNKGRSPFGVPGDRLWAAEAWRVVDNTCGGRQYMIAYRAGGIAGAEWHARPREEPQLTTHAKWRPSTNMPRWASRITLVVKRAWIEQVRDISEEDARAEGVDPKRVRMCAAAHRRAFLDEYWDPLYAKKGLGADDNPLVWACEFESVETEKARKS